MTEQRIRAPEEMSIVPPNLCDECKGRSCVTTTWTDVNKQRRRRRWCEPCRKSWVTVERRSEVRKP